MDQQYDGDKRRMSSLRKFDVFRTMPRDMVETTSSGAMLTFLACLMCTVLFLLEFTAFLRVTPVTEVVMDSNQEGLLKINFDVTMHDIACDHVFIGVWDSFGTDHLNITKGITMTPISEDGLATEKPSQYTEEELAELDAREHSLTEEEREELNADWASSSDSLKHNDFASAIAIHDLTFVNFFAEWCPHCKSLKPIWNKLENEVNSGQHEFKDKKGNKIDVHMLNMNCVDFGEECAKQSVRAYPAVRLYRRSSGERLKFEDYSGARTAEPLLKYLQQKADKLQLKRDAHYHHIFTTGCRLNGFVNVARVPGTLHIEAKHSTDKSINYAYTNTSHFVHSFSFGEGSPTDTKHLLPTEYQEHVAPLNEKNFVVDHFHMAPHHYIKVMSTRFPNQGMSSYQMTHHSNYRSIARSARPQASFSYDLSPVEVIVTTKSRRWYDFITSILALIGGTFTFMSMISGVYNVASKKFKRSIGKDN